MEWLSISLEYVPNIFIPQFMHYFRQITTHTSFLDSASQTKAATAIPALLCTTEALKENIDE